ncbi:hypothetical protein VKT23_005282 [Stygiomarasmius scandens]|uniref:F-box domain-containing protein n=1 Tax=Marasmiellus scandens TaxID=2682957 RepID=A0ABR1JSD3_9AGAR
MPFDDLPGELYDLILSHVPEDDLVKTKLSVTRALPYSGILTRRLFQDVCLKRGEQVLKFYQRLRRSIVDDPEFDPASTWVESFTLESWTADAEIVLNILSLLPNLTRLVLWVGPTNFTPEHLEELFDLRRQEAGSRCLKCVGRLEYLSVRFRPYVQKASYYQFLKGAYFDSALEAISSWPSTSLPRLSIIQDPLTDESSTSEGSEVRTAPSSVTSFSSGLPKRTLETGFAQPIVFFRLDTTVPELLRSDSIRLTAASLRLRLPGRDLTKALLSPPPANPPSFGAPIKPGDLPKRYFPPKKAWLPPAPNLIFLDVSSSSVAEQNIPLILGRYPSLEYLIADDCGVLRGDLATRDGCRDWHKLAKECCMAGAKKAREREKKIKEWIEEERIAFERQKRELQIPEEDKPSNATERGKTKSSRKGRKGLATSTISIKKNTNRNTGPGPPKPRADPVLFAQKIRILPTAPSLCAFSTSLRLSPTITSSDSRTLLDTIHNQWERGWSEGVATSIQIRNRLRLSRRNGTIRLMRFATMEEIQDGKAIQAVDFGRSQTPDSSSSSSPARSTISISSDLDLDAQRFAEEGLGGLIDVVDEHELDVDVTGTSPWARAPVLCLAGASGPFDPSVKIMEGVEASTSRSIGNQKAGTNLRVIRAHTEDCVHERGKSIWVDSL